MTHFGKHLALIGTCFAGLFATENALAGSSATSSLSNIQITIQDLSSPIEGPLPFAVATTSYAAVYADPLGGNPFRPSPDPAVYQYESAGPYPSTLPATSSQVSQPDLNGTAIATANSLLATADAANGYVSSSTGAGAYSFTLAPNTALTLSAWASVQNQSDGRAVGLKYWENGHSGASASISFDSPEGPYQHLADTLSIDTPWSTPSTLSNSRLLSLTYSNTSSQVIHASFSLQAAANATAAVPEPDTYALFLLGVSMIGILAGRSKQA